MLGVEFEILEPLPASVTLSEFETWKGKLKAHLESFENFDLFLPGGLYSTWKSPTDTRNGHRINSIHSKDPGRDPNHKVSGLLSKRNNQLNSFLNEIGKFMDRSEYYAVYKHSTSFNLIMDFLLEFRNSQCRPKNILQLRHLVYKDNQDLVQFYNSFRSMISTNLKRKGDKISFLGNLQLTCDETISPTFEDVIVMWCLEKIDPKLPDLVHKAFGLQLMSGLGLKDLLEDIFDFIQGMFEESNNLDQPIIKLECKGDTFEEEGSDDEFHPATVTADGIAIYVKKEVAAAPAAVISVPDDVPEDSSISEDSLKLLKSIPPLTRGVCTLCGTTLRKKNLKNHLRNKHKVITWDQSVFMPVLNQQDDDNETSQEVAVVGQNELENTSDKEEASAEPVEENEDIEKHGTSEMNDNSSNQKGVVDTETNETKEAKSNDFPSVVRGICILCGRKLRRKNFKTHLVRFHEKEKFSWSVKGMDDDDLFLELSEDQDCASTEDCDQVKMPKNEKFQGKTASFQKINCPLCEKSMRWKNMKVHFRKVHLLSEEDIRAKLKELRNSLKIFNQHNEETRFFQFDNGELQEKIPCFTILEQEVEQTCFVCCKKVSDELGHLSKFHKMVMDQASQILNESAFKCSVCFTTVQKDLINNHIEQDLEKLQNLVNSISDNIKCFFCDLLLDCKDLKCHMIEHHGWISSTSHPSDLEDASSQEKESVPCPICDSKVSTEHLSQHLVAAHRVLKSRAELMALDEVNCPICSTLLRPDQLKKHIQDEVDHQHHDTPPFSNLYCGLCDKNSKMISMKHHLIRVHQWYPNSHEQSMTKMSMTKTFAEDELVDAHGTIGCPVCFITMKSKELKSHMKKMHGTEESPRSPSIFMCEICGSAFDTKSKLRSHKLRHPELREDFLCPICGKVTTSMQSLSMHVNKHNLKFHCPKCTKNCKSDQGVQEHLSKKRCGRTIKRIRDKNLYCQTCKRHFIDENQMEKHKCAHLKCEQCGAEFVRLRNLKVHRRGHDGETIYPCEVCESLFLSRKKYQEHKRTIHDPNHRVYKFKCDMCDASFMSRSAANHHLQRVHVTERKFSCDFCSKKFKSIEHLRIHVNFTHKKGELQFSCNGCDKKFRAIGELKYHHEMVGCTQKNTEKQDIEMEENVEEIIFELNN